MAKPNTSLTKEQIFKQVKQLCMKADFVPSRHLICQAAGLNIADPMAISRASIRHNTANPVVHNMLDIEQAFVSLKKTFSETEPAPFMAETAVSELTGILPLLNNKEKLFTRYWINNCQAYIPDLDPQERLNNIQEMIRLTPKGENDSLLFNCSNIIMDLEIDSGDRYRTIKKAYQKINKTGSYVANFKNLLNKSSDRYFQYLMSQTHHTAVPYDQRCAAIYEAVEVANDLDCSVSRKCHLRISILSNLERVQRQSNDQIGLDKTTALKQKYTNQAFQISRMFSKQNPIYADRYR